MTETEPSRIASAAAKLTVQSIRQEVLRVVESFDNGVVDGTKSHCRALTKRPIMRAATVV